MSKNKVVVFGNGQFAEVAHHCLQNDSDYEVVAFTVDKKYCESEDFLGLPLVPFEEVQDKYSNKDYKMFVPISYKKMNKIREAKYKEAKDKGYELVSYVSSRAICNSKEVGENCLILELNNIQPGAKIGNNVILWSGNHIGHHSVIEDNCFIASHVVVSGSVNIGRNSFIGVNATIRDNISIGKESIIGAGSLVLKDTPDLAVISEKSTEISRVTSDKIRNI